MEKTDPRKGYADQFLTAVALSDQWGCCGEDDFGPEMPPGVTLSTYLDAIDCFIALCDGHQTVRIRCGEVHFRLWHFLRFNGLPATITIGDIVWNGTPVFGTTLPALRREWQGLNAQLATAFDAHVWLTLPDGKTVIDLTALPFMAGKLPPDFSWKDAIYISGFVNYNEPLDHIPSLAGGKFLLKSGLATPV